MKRIILILAAVMCCIPASMEAKKKGDGTITVMSYNIRTGKAKDGTNSWQYRYPASAMMLDDQKPDVFGVQEAYDYQVKYLTEAPGCYKSVGVGREDGKHAGEHMSVFYNKKTIKMLKWGTFWLSETPDVPSMGWDARCKRTATWALLKDKGTGKKFYFVNTHLDHVGWEARRKGLALIVDRIDSINPEGYPMVLTGDFNMHPDRPEFAELNKRMVSVREVAEKTDHLGTFNGWGKKEEGDFDTIIDYIYVKGFSAYPLYETVRKPYMDRKFISDHYPIKAVLKF